MPEFNVSDNVEDIDVNQILSANKDEESTKDLTLAQFLEYAKQHVVKPESIDVVDMSVLPEEEQNINNIPDNTDKKPIVENKITEKPQSQKQDTKQEKEIHTNSDSDKPITCPSCGFIHNNTDQQLDCSDEDKSNFLISAKTNQCFKKQYVLLDNSVRITFKSISKLDYDTCIDTIYQFSKQDNKNGAEVEDLYTDCMLLASLDAVEIYNSEVNTFVYIFKNKEMLSDWKCSTKDNSIRQMTLFEIIKYTKKQIKSIAIFNAITKCKTRFDSTFAFLNNHIFDENFYSATTKN